MNKNRLEAFSDGVFAIIITIMVLEIRVPAGITWSDIKNVLPTLGSYVLSFGFIAIYWGNHHHLIHTLHKVNGKILWANLHLLFWLSLVPIATTWMGANDFSSLPVAIYGALLVLCAVAFTILTKVILASRPPESELAKLLHKTGMKEYVSTGLYLASIPLAFVHPVISCTIFTIVAMMWIIPSKEVEELLGK